MDVLPSIWLSSVTSALFFFSGRLWGKALSLQQVIEPLIRGDRAARRRAEQEAADARDEAAAEIRRLSETVERLELEAIELRARVEELKGGVAADSARAEELDFTLLEAPSAPALRERRPGSEPKLEHAIAEHLDALRLHDGSWRTAVLSDMRGLLVASSGDVRHDDDLAAAAAMTSDTASRLRQLLSLGEPLEIRFVDVDNAVFRARWIRGDHDELVLATLGVGAAEADARADARCASISNLVRWT